ncbi:MAG: efflux RND transporter permease subunit [Oscillospiraceae bacterium]|nr:efflux RND transporter permease subunit [Oscillospiraceae bacterium]
MFSKESVKKPFTVLVCVIVVIVMGIVSFTRMVPDLLPSINLPYAIVMTTYIGASPEEVEQTVTRPVEQSMSTLNNIKTVSSRSQENVSIVILEFDDNANMDSATIDMRENLDQLTGNWDDMVGSPLIMKLNPDMLPVMIAALSVDGMSTQEISDYTSETLIPALEGIDGVGSVAASGLIEESINVVIRQEKVDKINEKLKKSVSEKLDDAKVKLDDAKNELTDNKKELEDALKKFNDGMLQGSQGISEAKFEILKNEIKLADGKEELLKKEKELLDGLEEIAKNEETMNSTMVTLKDGEEQLNSGISQIEAGIPQIEAGIEQTAAGITALEEAKKQLIPVSAGIAAGAVSNEAAAGIIVQTAEQLQIDSSSVKDIDSLIAVIDGKITETTAVKSGLEQQKTDLETQLEELKGKYAEVTDAKAQLENGMTELLAAKEQALQGKTALEAAKAELENGQKQLMDAKDQIGQKEAELDSARNENGKKLNDGLDAINDGETKLNEQIDKWDDTVSDALDKASVSDTLTVEMISNILRAQNFSMPAGYITEDDGTKYLVKIGDKIENSEILKNLVLFDLKIDGMDPVKLSDVADVFVTDNSDSVYASVDGEEGVILTFQKQNNYATAEVAESIQKKFASLSEDDSRLRFIELMNQGDYINLIVNSVLKNLLQGAVFAIIVLLLFLRDVRPTFIIACSIPISVIFAIALMYFTGITLNLISLSGLAIGVGMLVDNSVVVIENIYRLKNKGYSSVQASVSGARQVEGAITASTLTTVCVFAPIVFVEGITKTLFVDMALTIAFSLGASLIVALTVVPAMTSKMMKSSKQSKPGIFEKIQNLYSRAILGVLRFRIPALLAAVAVLIVSAAGAFSKGVSFMPEMDSTQISIDLEMPDGTKLEETVKASEEVMSRVNALKDVDTVGAMLSSGTASMFGMSVDASTTSVSMYVILKEDKEKTSQETAAEINEMFADADFTVTANGSQMDMSALGGSGVTINISGNDIEKLQETAVSAAELLSGIEGIGEVDDGINNPAPELKITVNKEKAMLNGLTVAQIYAEIAQNLSSSSTATSISSDGKDFDIIVEDGALDEITKNSIKNYKFTVTDNSSGDSAFGEEAKEPEKKEVKLSEMADIEETYTLSAIARRNHKRYISVSGTIADGYNVGLVSSDAEDAFKNFELPEGFTLSFAGENETIMESMEQLGLMLALAVVLIYLIMVAQFQSLKSPFIVMFTMPLAFTGGFIALLITDMELSVIGLLGFVMLSGIVVNNGIVLVDYINQLRLDGTEKRAAIAEAGATRLRPILMTAFTTILGLIMMAIGNDMGSDMVQPIAVVTIGGLVYATFTTLFIIPVVYDLFNKKEMKKIDNSELELIED